jgi:predicted RNA-binding protein with TRAM domain
VRDGRNTIESGVRYGVLPSGTEVVVAPAPLAAGQGYQVTVLWYTDAGNGMREVHASHTVFMP